METRIWIVFQIRGGRGDKHYLIKKRKKKTQAQKQEIFQRI